MNRTLAELIDYVRNGDPATMEFSIAELDELPTLIRSANYQGEGYALKVDTEDTRVYIDWSVPGPRRPIHAVVEIMDELGDWYQNPVRFTS
jgi:hypothetical protein